MKAADVFRLARLVFLGAWTQNRGRLALTLLAVALGVALGAAVRLINHSAATELTAAVRALSGDADVVVRGPRSGMSEDLYPRLARRDQVTAISPALELDAKLADPPGSLRIIGLDPLRALTLQPTLLGDATDRIVDLLQPDTVMISAAAAQRLGRGAGDSLQVQAGLRVITLKIIAVLPVNDALRQPLAVMDIAAVQWAFDQLGLISRIDLRLRSGTDVTAFLAALNRELPAGVVAAEGEMAAQQSLALSRAYRVNLDMLALVSLFTGAILVFSTQTLSLLRRRTHFALLRVLGLSSKMLGMLLLGEALLIGIVGSALGIALGVAAAHVGLAQAGSDLGAGFFAGAVVRAAIDPFALGVMALCGIVTCVLAGMVPALDAVKSPPAPALRAGDEQRVLGRLPRYLPGVVFALGGGVLALAPPIDGLPYLGYAAIACLLIAGLLFMPAYARAALRSWPPPAAPSLWLALQQLRGAPGYAGISLAAILASFSLTVAMLVMIHSFRASLEDWLHTMLPADVYARAGPGTSAWIDIETQARIQGLPGVARVAFSRYEALQLDARHPPVTLIARDLDPRQPEALPLVTPQRLPSDSTVPVWISEAVRALHGVDVGQRMTLPLAGRSVEVTVAGVWRDYIRLGGAVLISRADYVRLTGDQRTNEAWIWLAPGAEPSAAIERLRTQLDLGSALELRGPGTLRRISLATFDRTFAVTYALQLVAVLIGLFGISVSASAQAIARRREFGMLHHVGMARRQIGLALAFEGGLLGTLGAAAGMLVGGIMSLVLIHVINRQSFYWSMELAVPWPALLALAALLVVCSALTAAISARRALGEDVVRAVREDW